MKRFIIYFLFFIFKLFLTAHKAIKMNAIEIFLIQLGILVKDVAKQLSANLCLIEWI